MLIAKESAKSIHDSAAENLVVVSRIPCRKSERGVGVGRLRRREPLDTQLRPAEIKLLRPPRLWRLQLPLRIRKKRQLQMLLLQSLLRRLLLQLLLAPLEFLLHFITHLESLDRLLLLPLLILQQLLL